VIETRQIDQPNYATFHPQTLMLQIQILIFQALNAAFRPQNLKHPAFYFNLRAFYSKCRAFYSSVAVQHSTIEVQNLTLRAFCSDVAVQPPECGALYWNDEAKDSKHRAFCPIKVRDSGECARRAEAAARTFIAKAGGRGIPSHRRLV
jgi:hypothetical protein